MLGLCEARYKIIRQNVQSFFIKVGMESDLPNFMLRDSHNTGKFC